MASSLAYHAKNVKNYINQLDNIRSKPKDTHDKCVKEELKKLLSFLRDEPVNKFKTKILKLLKTFKQDKKRFIESFRYQDYNKSTVTLYDFYKRNTINPSLEHFYTLSTQKDNYLVKDYADSLFRNDIEKQFFDDLETHRFRIVQNEDNIEFHIEKKTHRGNFQLITSRSTGEVFILHLLALKHEINNLLIEKPNIMMFDEPDKSWDPDYIRIFFNIIYQDFFKKNNIQIILTTHRTDTIQIASMYDDINIGIFSMKNTGILDKTRIMRSHPLLVTFRLTKDRELINVKTKVYVESLNDYYFYSSFYRSFSNLCQEMRAFKQKRILKNRLMSRQYQLEFFSCALVKSASGGGDGLVRSVKRDLNSVNYATPATSKLVPYELVKPFGLIDLDYPDNPDKTSVSNEKKIKDENLTDRICILERRSLENFSYDTVLLLYNHQEDILALIKKAPESEFKQVCLECFKINPSELLSLNLLNSNIFESFFESIIEHSFETDVDKNTNIYQVYHFLRKIDKSYGEKFLEFKTVKAFKREYLENALKDYSTIKSLNFDDNIYKNFKKLKKKISYISTKPVMNGSIRTIEFNYPIVFLYFNGHKIVDNFIRLLQIPNKDKRIFEELIYNSRLTDLHFMPRDLINSFFKINQWNVDQANSILKKSDIECTVPNFRHKKFKTDDFAMEIDQEEIISLSQRTNLRIM